MLLYVYIPGVVLIENSQLAVWLYKEGENNKNAEQRALLLFFFQLPRAVNNNIYIHNCSLVRCWCALPFGFCSVWRARERLAGYNLNWSLLLKCYMGT
jgi:hypothetical protein